MWKYTCEQIKENTFLFKIQDESQNLGFNQVLKLWQFSADFRLFYNRLLADHDFEAFFWEHPPIAQNKISREYEFVLIDSPTLAKVMA